jgi:hypothetical protein
MHVDQLLTLPEFGTNEGVVEDSDQDCALTMKLRIVKVSTDEVTAQRGSAESTKSDNGRF